MAGQPQRRRIQTAWCPQRCRRRRPCRCLPALQLCLQAEQQKRLQIRLWMALAQPSNPATHESAMLLQAQLQRNRAQGQLAQHTQSLPPLHAQSASQVQVH